MFTNHTFININIIFLYIYLNYYYSFVLNIFLKKNLIKQNTEYYYEIYNKCTLLNFVQHKMCRNAHLIN